jgi:general stress protein YciG
MTPQEKAILHKIMSGYGKKGGTARAKNNSKEKLSEIGKLGSSARWGARGVKTPSNS